MPGDRVERDFDGRRGEVIENWLHPGAPETNHYFVAVRWDDDAGRSFVLVSVRRLLPVSAIELLGELVSP